jgi:hypothetical protein
VRRVSMVRLSSQDRDAQNLAQPARRRQRVDISAVMNEGLGGNRILYDIRGDTGLRRFDRDVLSQPGVTHIIVMLGTNDLRNRWKKPEEEPTAAQMIAGLKSSRWRCARIVAASRSLVRRCDADAVRQRNLHGQRLGIRGAKRSVSRSMAGSATAGPSTRSLISTRRCATPSIRRRCCPSTIAATVCIRAISVTTRWATRSTFRYSSNNTLAGRFRPAR